MSREVLTIGLLALVLMLHSVDGSPATQETLSFAQWSQRYRPRILNQLTELTGDAAEARYNASLTEVQRLEAMEQQKSASEPKARYNVNQFALLSEQEWKSRFSQPLTAPDVTSWASKQGLADVSPPSQVSFTNEQIATALQEGTVDWQTGANRAGVGAVTHVRNQGECGACYSFAVIAAVEGAWAAAGQPLTAFSEQWTLNCISQSEWLLGCNGGATSVLASSLISGSKNLPYAKDYEFSSYNNKTSGVCPAGLTGVGRVSQALSVIALSGQKLEDAMAAYVYYNGPLAVGVSASSSNWMHYTSGVLTCPSGPLDHAVTIVGYGTDNGVDYWKVKNSWSPSWGENGYVKVARGTNACLIGTANNVIGVKVDP